MKKDSQQLLEREIAWALAGPPASAYYYVVDRGRNRTIYGPFDTEKEAEYGGYFAKPVTERDKQLAKRAAHVYFMRGVQNYSAEEIKSLQRYPEEFELKSVQLRAGSPPMHASWKAFDKDFRDELRDKDYADYQRVMNR